MPDLCSLTVKKIQIFTTASSTTIPDVYLPSLRSLELSTLTLPFTRLLFNAFWTADCTDCTSDERGAGKERQPCSMAYRSSSNRPLEQAPRLPRTSKIAIAMQALVVRVTPFGSTIPRLTITFGVDLYRSGLPDGLVDFFRSSPHISSCRLSARYDRGEQNHLV